VRNTHEEGLFWSSRVLRANPVDGPIRQIVDEDVVRIAEWRQHRCRVLEQRRMKLVRIAAEEAVEVLEAQTSGPLIKWPSWTLHPLWNEVVLAKPRCVVTVVYENVADGTGTLGHNRSVAGVTRGELRDVAHPNALMVAASEKCSTGRGA
jgi:hypothetical protein